MERSDDMEAVRGRFAPSPTGELHLGSVWAAMLAWLQVRSANGTMVLRIEDIDPDRSRQHYTNALIQDLTWLGLNWDEGPDVGGPFAPYCQSERRRLFETALQRLTDRGLIYPCYCTRGELAALAPHASDGERPYPGVCRARPQPDKSDRKPALRLAVPNRRITFHDGVQGFISQELSAAGDFIVRRSDGVHAYQLAVVVDDAAMKITHVLRGQDLLDSTPRQIFIYELLGYPVPAFTHVPLLVAQDGHRLSKRQRDLSLCALRQAGAQPEKIIGYLAWKAGLISHFEAIEARELISRFDLGQISQGPIVIGDDAIQYSGADI